MSKIPMTDAPEEDPLYARLDKACATLLDRVFPDTMASGGQDTAPQVFDVKESVAVLRFVKDYLESRRPERGPENPKKSLIGEMRDKLNGGTAPGRRGPPKAPSAGGHRRAVARMAVTSLDGAGNDDNSEDAEPSPHH